MEHFDNATVTDVLQAHCRHFGQFEYLGDRLGALHCKASYLAEKTPIGGNPLYLTCTSALLRIRDAQGRLDDKLADYVNDLEEKIERALTEMERQAFCDHVHQPAIGED